MPKDDKYNKLTKHLKDVDPWDLRDAWYVLTPREKIVIDMLWTSDGETITKDEAADVFGVSSSKISAIEAKALAKLQEQLK